MAEIIIIAVVSPKGGTGKTTTSLGLAQAAAGAGYPTLFVDYDDRANATGSLVQHIDDTLKYKNAYDLVATEIDDTDDPARFDKLKDIQPMRIRDNLDLVPASPDLIQLDQEGDVDLYFRLGERIRALFGSSHRLAIIDTPGNLAKRVTSALCAANAAYAPIELNQYSLQSLKQLMGQVHKVRSRMNARLDFLGLVPNRVTTISTGPEPTPMLTDERAVYEKIKARMGPSQRILGMIGQRRDIRDTLSTGGSLQDIPDSDQSGKRAVEELQTFANLVFTRVGLR